MFRKTLILLFVGISNYLNAQTTVNKAANQALFNRIEYHFNLQETDSIYALSAAAFRHSLSPEAFAEVLDQQLYPLGRIRSAAMVDYDESNHIGTFKIDFNEQSLSLVLGLESERQFSTLLFRPYVAPIVEPEAPVQLELSREARTAASFDRLIDSLGLSYTKKPNTNALAIGVLNNNRTSSYFYGQVDSEDKRLPDEFSVFEIGSITKTFTATLLTYLADEGLVDMEASVLNYLPDSLSSNASLTHITLKMLANHTSGLPRLPHNLQKNMQENPENPYLGYHEEDLMDFLMAYQGTNTPGAAYDYSNLGFGLLGHILCRVTEKTYQEMIDEYIALPLGLKTLVLEPSVEQAEEMDVLPVHLANGQRTTVWQFDVLAGAGGLKSTVSTMMQYIKGHFDLPETPTQQALAQTRQFTFFHPPQTDLGLGWHIQLDGDNLVYWHNGGTGGSSSFLAFTPDLKTGVIVLSNTADSVDHIGGILLQFLTDQK